MTAARDLMDTPDPVDQHERNIIGINLLYWTSLRALAKENLREAALRYCVSERVAEEISGYDETQIMRLASGFTVQFRPGVSSVGVTDRGAVDAIRRLAGVVR